jgi:hypothetical protein
VSARPFPTVPELRELAEAEGTSVGSWMLLPLIELAEAAHRANIPADCGCGHTPCANARVLDALARLEFGAETE